MNISQILMYLQSVGETEPNPSDTYVSLNNKWLLEVTDMFPVVICVQT